MWPINAGKYSPQYPLRVCVSFVLPLSPFSLPLQSPSKLDSWARFHTSSRLSGQSVLPVSSGTEESARIGRGRRQRRLPKRSDRGRMLVAVETTWWYGRQLLEIWFSRETVPVKVVVLPHAMQVEVFSSTTVSSSPFCHLCHGVNELEGTVL